MHNIDLGYLHGRLVRYKPGLNTDLSADGLTLVLV